MTLTTLVAVLAVASVTQALDMSMLQPYNLTSAIMFQTEDTNSDGIMTIAEIEAVFNKYDTNGDGRESRREYTLFICDSNPALYQISHWLYDYYDVNGDHHLDQGDYDAFHAVMDVNNDGGVTEEEFVVYWEKMFTDIESQGNHAHGNSHEHGHCPH